MGRKRKRGKKRPKDSLQVDLLDGTVTEPEPEHEASETSSDEQRRTLQDGGDRWAKAVGRLERSRRGGNRPPTWPPDALPSDSSQRSEDAQGSDAGDLPGKAVPPTRQEANQSARDHVAAGARLAGEPLARARDLVEHGRIHEAIELYLGILTVHPSNLKAHNNLGVLLDGLKRFEGALKHFEAAERLAPENVEVLLNYASTLTSLARYEEAEELLRKAQRLSSEDVRARLEVAILHFRRGLYGHAEAELGWVCERDELNGRAFYYRGEALNRLGRFNEAGEALQRAAELMPDDPRPFYTLGHVLDRQHRLQEAAEMYRKAQRLQAQ